MNERVESITAWVVALAVNALLLVYLSAILRRDWIESATREQSMQVVFITKTVASKKPVAIELRPHSRFQVTTRLPRLDSSPKLAEAVRDSTQLDTLSVIVGATHSTADSLLMMPQAPEAPASDFKPNPLASKPPPMLPTVPKTKFRMIDSSIGGRLAAMTKAQICGDLGRALTKSPESAAAILASKERYGCGRRD